eukprot:997943-Amphidinium_carterae.1
MFEYIISNIFCAHCIPEAIRCVTFTLKTFSKRRTLWGVADGIAIPPLPAVFRAKLPTLATTFKKNT